jgi:GMP synthase (glutamine-hydrolysing)
MRAERGRRLIRRATLIHRAIGDRLTCIFVNNGVLRKNEGREVLELFADRMHLNLRYVDGTDAFSPP